MRTIYLLRIIDTAKVKRDAAWDDMIAGRISQYTFHCIVNRMDSIRMRCAFRIAWNDIHRPGY